jgi:hypothetical protein
VRSRSSTNTGGLPGWATTEVGARRHRTVSGDCLVLGHRRSMRPSTTVTQNDPRAAPEASTDRHLGLRSQEPGVPRRGRTECPFWNGAARLRGAQNNGRRDQQRRARSGVPCIGCHERVCADMCALTRGARVVLARCSVLRPRARIGRSVLLPEGLDPARCPMGRRSNPWA